MVRALLAGTKTQTRRVVKPVGNDDSFVLQDYGDGWWPFRSDDGETAMKGDNEIPHSCPYGRPGERLWVREAWGDMARPGYQPVYAYRADPELGEGWALPPGFKWRPSIHMPRAASRITLEVTGVRVERLQDISEADAIAEGIEGFELPECGGRFWLDYRLTDAEAGCSPALKSPVDSYRWLWESINGPGSWDANPFVWVVEFRKLATEAAA